MAATDPSVNEATRRWNAARVAGTYAQNVGREDKDLVWTAQHKGVGPPNYPNVDTLPGYVVTTAELPDTTVQNNNAGIIGGNAAAWNARAVASGLPILADDTARNAAQTRGTGAPGAPTSPTRTQASASSVVGWTPPASKGAGIAGYEVTSSPGGIKAYGGPNDTSVNVTGLTNGTPYTFTIKALGKGTNADSVASAASASVTPA